MGAGAGELLHHKTADKLGEQAGETIPLGGAGLIVAYSHSEAEKVEPAVTRAVQKVKGEAEGRHVQALKDALADAQQKMAERAPDLEPLSRRGRSESRRCRSSCPVSCPAGQPPCIAGSRSRGRGMSRPSGS